MGSPVKRRIKRKICDPDESHQPKKARESSEEDVEMPVAQPVSFSYFLITDFCFIFLIIALMSHLIYYQI